MNKMEKLEKLDKQMFMVEVIAATFGTIFAVLFIIFGF